MPISGSFSISQDITRQSNIRLAYIERNTALVGQMFLSISLTQEYRSSGFFSSLVAVSAVLRLSAVSFSRATSPLYQPVCMDLSLVGASSSIQATRLPL